MHTNYLVIIKNQVKEDIRIPGNRMIWKLRLGYWRYKKENPTCLTCDKSNSIENYLIECNKDEQERRNLKLIFHNLNIEFTMKACLHIDSD